MAGIEGSIHCVLLRSSTPFPNRLRHFQVRAESSACVVAGSRVERGAPSWVFPFEKIAACTMERAMKISALCGALGATVIWLCLCSASVARGQGNSGTLVKRPRILGVAHMAL